MICRLLPFLLCCPGLAQQPVADSFPTAGRTRETGGFTVSDSFEFGYRAAGIGGDRDLYSASANYGDGLRLFGGELNVRATDGKGSVLDRFSLRSSGAGDPYQAHRIAAERNGLYRYAMQYRLTRYRNGLPAWWRGGHGLATRRTLQSHDLTLLPDSDLEVQLGYERNVRAAIQYEHAAAYNEQARAMENTPIPVNQQITTRHLKSGVALFPIAPRRTVGAQ